MWWLLSLQPQNAAAAFIWLCVCACTVGSPHKTAYDDSFASNAISAMFCKFVVIRGSGWPTQEENVNLCVLVCQMGNATQVEWFDSQPKTKHSAPSETSELVESEA